jgi:hypothetical protein
MSRFYSRTCGSYQDFHDKGLLPTRKLLNQGFILVKLKSSLRKFYVTIMTRLTVMEIYVTNATTGAGTVNPSGAPDLIPINVNDKLLNFFCTYFVGGSRIFKSFLLKCILDRKSFDDMKAVGLFNNSKYFFCHISSDLVAFVCRQLIN